MTAVNTIRPWQPNLLINGGFDFWQRGASVNFSVATTSFLGVDRWQARPGGTPSGTVSRDTDTPSSAIPWSLKTVGTGGSSSMTFYQKIEADAIKPYIGQTMTFSLWMKQTSNPGYQLRVVVPVSGVKDSWNADIANDTVATSTTLSFATNTWTQVSFTFVVPASAQFGMAMGFQGTAVNGTTAWAAGAMLTLGANIPSQFYRQGITLQQELALCQRYYYQITAQDTATIGVGHNQTGNQYRITLPLPVPLRTATPTISSAGNGFILMTSTAQAVVSSVSSSIATQLNGAGSSGTTGVPAITLGVTCTFAGAGNGVVMATNGASTLTIDAEL